MNWLGLLELLEQGWENDSIKRRIYWICGDQKVRLWRWLIQVTDKLHPFSKCMTALELQMVWLTFYEDKINPHKWIPSLRLLLKFIHNNVYSNIASFLKSSCSYRLNVDNLQNSFVVIISYYLLSRWLFLILWLHLSTVLCINIKCHSTFLYWISNSNIS